MSTGDWLSYGAAARLARVDRRTLQRWRAEGMPGRVAADGTFEIERETVLAWKRRKAFMNPAGFRARAASTRRDGA